MQRHTFFNFLKTHGQNLGNLEPSPGDPGFNTSLYAIHKINNYIEIWFFSLKLWISNGYKMYKQLNKKITLYTWLLSTHHPGFYVKFNVFKLLWLFLLRIDTLVCETPIFLAHKTIMQLYASISVSVPSKII